MINFTEFLASAESEYLHNRELSSRIKSDFLILPPEIQKAIKPPFMLLGLSDYSIEDSKSVAEINQADRFSISRILLLKIYADSNEPRWSSHLIKSILEAILAVPGSNINDFLIPFYHQLSSVSLTESTQSLIRDIKIISICDQKKAYEAFSPCSILSTIDEQISCAQVFFIIWFIPSEEFNSNILIQVLNRLKKTHFWKQALIDLQDVITRIDLIDDIEEWLKREKVSPFTNHLRELISGCT